MHVMTFNLRYASAPDEANCWINPDQSPERREVVLKVLRDHAPDIIGFQEGEDKQLDYLSANLPRYKFQRSKPSGGRGNENAAIAWNTDKVDFVESSVFSLGLSPGSGHANVADGTKMDPYDFFPGMGLPFPRIALRGTFIWKASGREFLFYSTHFDFNETPQRMSVQLILDDVRCRCGRTTTPLPVILVGDFNGHQLGVAWKYLAGNFTDCWQEVHGGWENSGTMHNFNGGIPPENERIDWILHCGGFRAIDAVVVRDAVLAVARDGSDKRLQYPSDHYPVKAILEFLP